MKTDVVVVGAGPSGLIAAIELAETGLSVIVLDEFYRPGGRLLGQLYEDPYLPKEAREWNGKEIATKLSEKAVERGVRIYTNTVVWSISGFFKIEVTGAISGTIDAKAVLLSTGSVEKGLPVPGWTLPGVITIGAAQTLTNLHRIKVGKKVLIVGIDPLALSVMVEMNKAGIEVARLVLPPQRHDLPFSYSPLEALERLEKVVHLAPNPIVRKFGRIGLERFKPLLMKTLYFDVLKSNGTKLSLRKALVAIEGKDQVEGVYLQNLSSDGTPVGEPVWEAVDTVCLSGGLYPSMDLAQVAGCDIAYVSELGGMVPVHGKDMSTTVPGLFVSGNITGIEGAKVAMAQGRVAAHSIQRFLGKVPERSLEAALAEVDIARRESPLSFLPEILTGREKMEEIWKGKNDGRHNRLSV